MRHAARSPNPSLTVSALLFGALVGLAALPGCGGNSEEPQTPASKDAKSTLTPMEELKAIPADLDADVAALTKPIDDIQSAIDDIGALPKKHGLAAADLMLMAKGTFENGKVELKLNADVGAAAKADVQAALDKLASAVTALKSTPDKVAALTTKVAGLAAKVPVLASKVTASATVTASSPFGDAGAKAQAKADLESIKTIQADVMKTVSGVQAKIAGIPTMATSALAKASASFSGG
jgi:prefoldin subunit 5